MPSAIAHAAPALALIPAFYRPHIPKRLWVLGVVCAAAPDLDVLAFSLGVPYEHPLGHRGLWHSVPFAALASGVVTLLAFPKLRPGFSRRRAWLYLFLTTASHGLEIAPPGSRGLTRHWSGPAARVGVERESAPRGRRSDPPWSHRP